MIIIELTYKQPLAVVNSLLGEHRAFLDKYYAQGVFIASGPKDPRDGGIILALGDKESIASIIKDDPFCQHSVADYKITQFAAVKYSQLLEAVMKSQNS